MSGLCPTGDDELTTGQTNEIQVLQCQLDGTAGQSEFYLTFKGQTTGAIQWNDPADVIKTELDALSTIGTVEVRYANGGVSACDRTNLVEIEFLTDFGNQPNIFGHDATGPLETFETAADDLVVSNLFWGYDGFDASNNPGPMQTLDASVFAAQSVKGTKEDAPCSNRGQCNMDTGTCECYDGYYTSNGDLGAGQRGDCGFAGDAITACPGHLGVECSGHGVCSKFPQYTCACQAGWMGGDCNLRTCPTGRSWFELPTANEVAHLTLTECSDKGNCNRETGKCDCQNLFEGEACERSACPPALSFVVCCLLLVVCCAHPSTSRTCCSRLSSTPSQ